MDVEEAEFVALGEGSIESLIEISFGVDFKAPASAEKFGQLMVLPVEDVVEGAFLEEAFGGVTFVVEDDDDGVEAVAEGGGEFLEGHLECSITDENDGAEIQGFRLHRRRREWRNPSKCNRRG